MTGRGERWRAKAARAAAVLVLCGAAALAASFPAFQSTSAGPTERWYVVRIGGQNVGYVHDTTSPLSDGANPGFATTSEMSFALNRLGARVELVLSTAAEESASGSLRKLSFDLKASMLTMRTEVTVGPGVLEIKSGSTGTPFVRTMPYAGELVGPEGTRRLTLEKLRKPGDRAEYQTFEPSLGKVVKAVRVLLGPDSLSLDGTALPALKVEETNDALPDKRTFWLGEDGEVLRDEEPSPFGLAEVVRSDRAKALAAAGGGELPSEFFEQTLLKTGLRLPRPRDIDYLKIRLVHRRPELGWPEIPGSYQKVVAKTSTTLDLEVRRTGPGRAAAFPVAVSDRNRADLEPNAYLQSDDPALRALAASLAGTETDAWRAALKLRRWVADHMTFDLGIAFAPSVEIFKNRRGTCVGYATILAALARAAGIPSRVVMGYAYTLGLFGGHAWTEVLIGDDWVPLDAALPSAGSADAARFHLAESTLADGAGALVEGAQRVMGYIDVQVLEYRVEGGRTIRVPSGARPYEVKGDTYLNPWLDLEVRAPAGFKFGRLDEVWPSTRLVEMLGPNGSRIELHEIPVAPWDKPDEAAWSALARLGVVGTRRTVELAGGSAYEVGGGSTAGLARAGAGEIWIVKAEGTAGLGALEKNVSRMIRLGRS
jgi:transglutaminase-like putative cysteine protease